MTVALPVLLSHPLYLPSTENASRTLPGIPPAFTYPELVKSMPPAIAGPGPFNEPPRAVTPLTVWYGTAVSTSHRMAPFVVD